MAIMHSSKYSNEIISPQDQHQKKNCLVMSTSHKNSLWICWLVGFFFNLNHMHGISLESYSDTPPPPTHPHTLLFHCEQQVIVFSFKTVLL